MRRRDFLRLRTRATGRVVEISCETLLAQWIQAHDEARGSEGGASPASGLDDEAIARALFHDLDVELRAADVLRVVDRDRLSGASGALRSALGEAIAQFRTRGGRVEMTSETTEPPATGR